MTGPDDGAVYVTFRNERVALRFPCGAIYSVQRELGEEGLNVAQASQLIYKMSADNLGTFFWGGLLHHDRKLELETVRDEIAWGDTGMSVWQLTESITKAWELSVAGSILLEEEGDAEGKLMRALRRLIGVVSSETAQDTSGSTPESSGGSGP